MRHGFKNRTLCGIISVCLCLAFWEGGAIPIRAAAAIPISLKQAQALALANNKSYKKIQTKVSLQRVKYAEAVKSIWLKQKDMMTFRWSPLLSFKFPEWPDLADSYDWQYKPIQIQCELTTLLHELEDVQFKTKETVSNLYTEAYIAQEKAAFAESQKLEIETTLSRNQIRVQTGEASQSDVDKMEQSLEKLESDISLRKRELENLKKKITGLIQLDISSGFRLENPLADAEITRDILTALTEYTLEHDQGYYEAKMNSRLGRISLELNEKLIDKKYGSKMNGIRAYVNQAKDGEDMDEDAFKAAYDNFLETIERPWNGNIQILFIKIPKEWFKGSLDGVRYIEDDPYVLYTNSLEYVELREEEALVKQSLETSVTDSFEAAITAQNSYQSLQKETEKQRQELEKTRLKNQTGEITYEELKNAQDSYEEIQLQTLDAGAAFSELLYSFDRLTCGGITAYLVGELTGLERIWGGDSVLEETELEGAVYYIRTKAEDNVFLLGIQLPENFSLSVTDFELWVNGIRIGERTAAGTELKHLTLALDGIDKASLRLFEGDTFLDECEIDPMVSSGELKVSGGYEVISTETKHAVADFTCHTDNRLGLTVLSFQAKAGEALSFYQVQDLDGNVLFHDTQISINDSFSYLALAGRNLKNLQVIFYDAKGEPLYTAYLDESRMEAVVE